MSLKDFVAKQRVRLCPVCSLPPAILKELHEGADSGIGPNTILAWLREEHPDETVAVSRHYLDLHKRERHHATPTA